MFKKFGEFDSVEELNMAAEGQLNEGDEEGLKNLAKENGIPEEFVEMYWNGDIPFLCDAQMAAEGKLEVEMKDIEEKKKVPVDMAEAIKEYLMSRTDDEKVARAIRREGKRISACIDAMQKEAQKRRGGKQMVCIPPAEAFRIVRSYYES